MEVRSLLDEKGEADSWKAAEAIARFGQSGIDVLNLSFGSHTEDNERPGLGHRDRSARSQGGRRRCRRQLSAGG